MIFDITESCESWILLNWIFLIANEIRKWLSKWLYKMRKQPPKVFQKKKCVFRNFASTSTLLKKRLRQVFSCEFCEISKNIFFTEHLGATASENDFRKRYFMWSSFHASELNTISCIWVVTRMFPYSAHLNRTKKWSFLLRISSENVNENWEFAHRYWRKPQWKTLVFVQRCSLGPFMEL